MKFEKKKLKNISRTPYKCIIPKTLLFQGFFKNIRFFLYCFIVTSYLYIPLEKYKHIYIYKQIQI